MAGIALLIPVYNNQRGLLDSLAALQTEEPLDAVVVDDGSDPPIEVPDQANGHRVYRLRLDPNQGIEHALNEGLAFIRRRGYEFVARLDAGDVALPTRFAKQKRFLLEHPDCMLVSSHVEFVDAQGRHQYLYRVPITPEQVCRKMHLKSCFLHPAVMFRASALDQIGGYRLNYPAAEDYEFFFRFVRRWPAANLNCPLTRTIITPNSISLGRRRMQILSRLRIKLRYFDPRIHESYVGVLRDIVLLMLPARFVLLWKRRWLRAQGTG